MQGILYLWKVSMKNRIKDLKTHPSKLIAYLVFIALMIFCAVSTSLGSDTEAAKDIRPISGLGAVIFGLFLFLFITQSFQSLSSENTFFRMCDVNFLFTSPVSQRIVLLYGLVRQLGISFLLSFFILFQSATLKRFYGVGFSSVVLLFIGYYLLTVVSSIVSMAIYIVTSGNEKKKKIVRVILYAIIIPVIISVMLSFLDNGRSFSAIPIGLNSGINEWIPFAGWIKAIIYRILTGDSRGVFVYLILTILGLLFVLIVIFKSKNNYYEDVIVAAETQFEAVQNVKSGKVKETGAIGKTKITRTGINRGRGASVILPKHMLENRRAGFFMFDKFSLIQIVFVVICCIVCKDAPFGMLTLFGIMVYLQLFISFTGRWVRELSMPYVYMMPEKPLKKLLFMVSEGIIKSTFDGILIFIIAGVMLNSGIIPVIVCIAARFGFSVLFISGDILAEKVLGNIRGKAILTILTFMVIIVVALPGIIGTIIVGISANGNILCLLVSLAWNLAASLLIMFLCRNILHSMEQLD